MTPDAQHNSSPPSLLLVDDDKDIHVLLRQRLRSESIEVISAENGIDGLRRAREIQPDLILLDLNMPIMDGFEVLRELKEDSQTRNIPVVFISGSQNAEDKVIGFDLGAIDFVCKPFDMPELRARLRSVLRVSQLMKMLEQRAQIDGLTGLWNRAYFNDRLDDEIASVERSGAALSLAMCDLDKFKQLNDQHGHPAGDAVIQGFAELLGNTLRKEDIACRYGGEEFALILRNTNADHAREVLERIRCKLEETVWPRHPERTITASFGVCDLASAGSFDPADWVEVADKALYQAKHSGRNTIILAPSENTPQGLTEAA